MNIGAAPEDGEEESRLLLRFAAPRDPVMVADWVSFNVIDTERQDWARGWAALRKFTEREGSARVPYGHREGATPLGQWVAEQRRAYGAGQLSGRRAARLERLGMVWDVADAAFQENLEAARAYRELHFSLCAPRSAVALDRPVGQWLSNLRRPGALAGHPEREAALAAIDPDWNPAWPEVLPGFTVHGMDVGRFAQKPCPAAPALRPGGQKTWAKQPRTTATESTASDTAMRGLGTCIAILPCGSTAHRQ
ncbi:helicase associated domain-containing protein [Streptomyces kaempferi]|uniref:Helicase associated domain-containing protein n=1 Tax=Streptomyces kaempferi TaxID=333725 RepID=A0ABW3XIF9_9ACTN